MSSLVFSRWVFRAALLASLAAHGAEARLEFNRDVRPILSENCFHCHGQDEARREGKLRLDVREGALAVRDGVAAVVPGKPDESELVRRILAKDPNDVMPPPDSHRTLTSGQVDILKRWVSEGAAYQGHWAFEVPRKGAPGSPLAHARGHGDGGNAIDGFVKARLAKEGLRMSGSAAPGVWLRRVSLDLTGLPPTVAEMDRFEAEAKVRSEAAYEAAVERLLGSAHYGERMAVEWLDAARYADTHGFNNDSARSMWRWRDWVIEAFNANMRYDRFITEQLAGDLLPKPTLEQRIATGFSRNHVINSEGGIIDEEYRVEYVADRVRTVSTAWLGLTMECARCHDHKFDPITQKDYYRLFAFFNNVLEHGEDGRVANAVPQMAAPTREQQAELAKQEAELKRLDAEIASAAAKSANATLAAKVRGEGTSGAGENGKAGAENSDKEGTKAESVKAAQALVNAEKGAVMLLEDLNTKGGKGGKIAAEKLDFGNKDGLTVAFWVRSEAENPRDVALFSGIDYSGSLAGASYGRGKELRLVDGEIEVRWSDKLPVYALIVRTDGARIAAGAWRHVAVTFTGGKKAADVRMFVDGSEVATDVRYDGLNGGGTKREFYIGTDGASGSATFCGKIEDARSYPRVVKDEVVGALWRVRALIPPEGGTTNERVRELVAEREKVWRAHLALRRALPTVMVMEELGEPRAAFVLNRGQYDQHGERVEAGVPENLMGAWPKGAPKNRLGLAQWLTKPDHPLTARVVVNRMWAQFFGTGIVKTLEDFGSQSEWPSHPELLDWLAREFVDGGWDVKRMVRTIVLSQTYRQSSSVAAELAARDPENRLLARGPRVRLPAETIRDQALAVSGLLVPKIGGPSVYPYQPEKLYAGIVVEAPYPGTVWLTSEDAGLYRRSLYTFWKRTMPHPAMTTFDAPDREFCSVRRSRTNTPLQALVLWNEPGLVEAARKFGTRILREAPGEDDAARVSWAFQAATGRKPRTEEVAVLGKTWAKLREDFGKVESREDAEALVKVGSAPVDGSVGVAELAAATALANVILSLDEVITKN